MSLSNHRNHARDAVAKRAARDSELTLSEQVEARRKPASENERPAAVPLPPPIDGGGLRPGIDLGSNRSLWEALDGGVPFENLR